MMVGLTAALAVLLPAAVVAATVDRPAPANSVDGRVGAAALGLEGVVDVPATHPPTTVAPTTVPATLAPPTTTPPPAMPRLPAPVVTLPAPATTVTTAPVVLPPAPPAPPTGGLPPGLPAWMYPQPLPDIPPASSWSVEQNGLTLHLRMEPAAPVAGQPVRFIIDQAAGAPCCALGLGFGDSPDILSLGGGTCTTDPNRTGIVATHTYAAAGSYTISLVAATFPCNVTIIDGHFVPGTITGAGITGCVAVGPGPATPRGCPAPPR